MADESHPLILGDSFESEMHDASGRRQRTLKNQSAPLTHCENCGALLAGSYCAQCGQVAIDYRRSFGTLLVDAADAFFNVDARFFKTFGLLLFKPWRLTNEFLAGRRHRYVHPLRVYLMASLAFFLLVKQLHHNGMVHASAGPPLVTHRQKANATIPAPSPSVVIPTPNKIAAATPTLFPIATANGSASAVIASPVPSAPISQMKPGDRDGFSFKIDADDEKEAPTPFLRWIQKRADAKIGHTGDKGQIFLQALMDNLPYMVLCCIPLFAGVLKLIYIGKRRYYIEHLVFALHTHAFVFMATIVIIGIGFLLAWKIVPLAAVACTFLGLAVLGELLVAIRRVYRQNWFATVFKFAFGSIIYLCLLSIAFAITAVVTLILP